MKRQIYFLFALQFLAVYAGPVVASPLPHYAITNLGILSDDINHRVKDAKAYAINDAGMVVGDSGGEAFLWKSGKMRDLGTLGGFASTALAVNDKGEVVGYSQIKEPKGEVGDYHPFLYSHGKMRDLGTLPGYPLCQAAGINAQGKIVGWAWSGREDSEGVADEEAIIWSGGKIHALAGSQSEAYGINRYNFIVGKAQFNGFNPACFVPAKGGYGVGQLNLENGWGLARTVNARGQVIGNSGVGNSQIPRYPILWNQLFHPVVLPLLPDCENGDVKAINNFGIAVGVSEHGFAEGWIKACRWENGEVTDLNTLIPPGSGWTLSDATGINDRGQICGSGSLHGQPRAFLLTPLPEKP